jgi:hypothetical protein
MMLAIQAAVGAEAFHGIMEMLRTGENMQSLPPLPPVREWLKMYRSHMRLQNVLLDGYFPSGDPTRKTSKFANSLSKRHRAFCRKSTEERNAIDSQIPVDVRNHNRQKVAQGLQAVAARQTQVIRDDIAGRVSEHDRECNNHVWHTPEMQFFFRVWIPWIFLHDQNAQTDKEIPNPVRLMRKARDGNINAICDLLRLDKMAIAEPRIAQHFAAAYAIKHRARFNRMAKALASPSKSLKPWKVNTLLAGYISKIASAWGFPIDNKTIADLFKRVALDRGRDDDLDIPAPYVFNKRVQRGRKPWNVIPDPPPKVDKNRA